MEVNQMGRKIYCAFQREKKIVAAETTSDGGGNGLPEEPSQATIGQTEDVVVIYCHHLAAT